MNNIMDGVGASLTLKKKIAELINSKVDLEVEKIEQLIEIPPRPEMKLIGEYQDLLEKINQSYDEKLNERLLSLQTKMDDLNLWDLESKEDHFC